MKKYVLYFGAEDIRKNVRKHKLVGVVQETNINSALAELTEIAKVDATSRETFHDCEALFDKLDSPSGGKYSYSISLIVSPNYSSTKNFLVEYGIVEKDFLE